MKQVSRVAATAAACLALALGLALAPARGAAADAAAAPLASDPADDTPAAGDWAAIRGVIGDQRTALRAEDGPRAFGLASSGLRAQFATAATFMRMVHAGDQPLIDARYAEFLDGAVIDGRVIQPLRLVLADETVLVALYTMVREDDGRWRIAGCMLAPSTLKST